MAWWFYIALHAIVLMAPLFTYIRWRLIKPIAPKDRAQAERVIQLNAIRMVKLKTSLVAIAIAIVYEGLNFGLLYLLFKQ